VLCDCVRLYVCVSVCMWGCVCGVCDCVCSVCECVFVTLCACNYVCVV